MNNNYTTITLIVITFVITFFLTKSCNNNIEVDTYKPKYFDVKDSLDRIDSLYKLRIDGLKIKIDSVTKIDSIYIDSLIKNKIKDNDAKIYFRSHHADTSYNYIKESIR